MAFRRRRRFGKRRRRRSYGKTSRKRYYTIPRGGYRR